MVEWPDLAENEDRLSYVCRVMRREGFEDEAEDLKMFEYILEEYNLTRSQIEAAMIAKNAPSDLERILRGNQPHAE